MIELLVVIAIIGLLAAITVPNLRVFKPNVMAAASRQFLDDVARARQLAISQRTTVFMVFVPTNFWNDLNYNKNWTAEDLAQARQLLDKQYIGYNFVSLHSLGDQPGRSTPRYLGTWKTLPEGTFIDLTKFGPINPPNFLYQTNGPTPSQVVRFTVRGFSWTNDIPFPRANTPSASAQRPLYVNLPYLAFNSMGQLVNSQNQLLNENQIIPLALGSVGIPRDQGTKTPIFAAPSFTQIPPGNSTLAFNLVNIDWLTGRARIERQEVR